MNQINYIDSRDLVLTCFISVQVLISKLQLQVTIIVPVLLSLANKYRKNAFVEH